jgi:hypothetical protein
MVWPEKKSSAGDLGGVVAVAVAAAAAVVDGDAVDDDVH